MSASRQDLPYRVYCKTPGCAFYDLIAAFDTEDAAMRYAETYSRSRYSYQVRKRGTLLRTYGEES